MSRSFSNEICKGFIGCRVDRKTLANKDDSECVFKKNRRKSQGLHYVPKFQNMAILSKQMNGAEFSVVMPQTSKV